MSKKMIAVDVDDVLAVHYEALAQFHNERYGTNHTANDYISDHWSHVWGTDEAETERRAQEFAKSGLHAGFQLVAGAPEALKRLQQRYNLAVVTARRKDNVAVTRAWLMQHFPNTFQEIRFVPMWEPANTITKADICKEIGATYLIDDNVRHCYVCDKAGITALLFGRYAWNESEALEPKVVRVKDWPAVLEYFDAEG